MSVFLSMRSQFLTLLCVLTFLSCGIGLFDAIVSLTRTQDVAETTAITRKPLPDDQRKKEKAYFEDRASGDVPMPDDPALIQPLAIAQLLYSALTLIGAILMFRLRRIGFWIYVAGAAVGLILPVILAGFGALNVSFGVFFSLLFVYLYWTNIGEMR
jgi:type III secretory pathway component EscR